MINENKIVRDLLWGAISAIPPAKRSALKSLDDHVKAGTHNANLYGEVWEGYKSEMNRGVNAGIARSNAIGKLKDMGFERGHIENLHNDIDRFAKGKLREAAKKLWPNMELEPSNRGPWGRIPDDKTTKAFQVYKDAATRVGHERAVDHLVKHMDDSPEPWTDEQVNHVLTLVDKHNGNGAVRRRRP